MKIESYAMGDHEVLDALIMFIDEVKERGYWKMVNVEDAINSKTSFTDFFRSVGDDLGADEIALQCALFANNHPSDDWQVFILYKTNEVAGVIAFAGYQ